MSAPQGGELPHGPGMFVRWLGGLLLAVAAVVVPYAVLGGGSAGIDSLIGNGSVFTESKSFRPGDLFTGTAQVIRVFFYFAALTVVFLLVYHRRPSIWSKIVLWSGFLVGFELVAFAFSSFAIGSTATRFDGPRHPAWALLYLVAAPLAPLLSYHLANAAKYVLTRPLTRELGHSVVEVPYRMPKLDLWLLLQHDRIARAEVGRRIPVTHGANSAILWTDVEYLQLGEVAEGSTFRAPGPVLRVVGDGRQWLLPVDREHAHALFAVAVGKAERALRDTRLVKQVDQHREKLEQRRAKARRDIATAESSMGSSPTTVGGGPFGALVVAIACLSITVFSLVPEVLNLVFTEAHVGRNVPGGIVFGAVGVIAAVVYLRYARAVRFEQAHPEGRPATNTEPNTAPVPAWTALGPPVYPRRAQQTDDVATA